MPRARGGADVAVLNLVDAPTDEVAKEEAAAAVKKMPFSALRKPLLDSMNQFLQQKPTVRAVKQFFQDCTEIYNAASLKAREKLDSVGGQTLDGFNAWVQEGLNKRGEEARQWASMANTMSGGAKACRGGVSPEVADYLRATRNIASLRARQRQFKRLSPSAKVELNSAALAIASYERYTNIFDYALDDNVRKDYEMKMRVLTDIADKLAPGAAAVVRNPLNPEAAAFVPRNPRADDEIPRYDDFYYSDEEREIPYHDTYQDGIWRANEEGWGAGKDDPELLIDREPHDTLMKDISDFVASPTHTRQNAERLGDRLDEDIKKLKKSEPDLTPNCIGFCSRKQKKAHKQWKKDVKDANAAMNSLRVLAQTYDWANEAQAEAIEYARFGIQENPAVEEAQVWDGQRPEQVDDPRGGNKPSKNFMRMVRKAFYA